MKDKMKERGSGTIEDGLNVALHVVLMMNANPGETPELVLIVAVRNPFFGSDGM